MQGASGNREGNDGDYGTLPDWAAAAHNEIGYGILTQSADTNQISWKFIESSTNNILDSAVWEKK